MGLVAARAVRRCAAAAAWLFVVALGCRSQPEGPFKASPSRLRSASAGASPKASSESPPPSEPPPPWAEALRAQRYKEAERAFSALPVDAQHNAEVRFAWARTRLELGQAPSALPLLAVAVTPAGARVGVAVVVTLIALGVLGDLGARLGGAPPRPAIVRAVAWGAAAMAVTAGIGALVGTVV